MSDAAAERKWARVAFGELVKLSGERSIDPRRGGLERYVGLDHLDPGDMKIRRWGNVSDGTTFTSVFRPGQVLFGKRRAYQRKVAVADFSGVCSGDIYVFEPNDSRLLPELLPFICRTDGFFEHAIGTSAGSLSPRTNWSNLASYEFALPPLEEQAEIVDALGAVMTMREATKDLLLKALMMHRANLNQLQSSSAFEEVILDILLERIVAGKSSVGVDTAPSDGEYGVLKVSAIDPGGFIPHESKRLLNPADFNPDFSLHANDLVITRANTAELVGEVCLVERDYPNLMLSDKTLRLEPNAGVDPYLLLETLQSGDVRRQLIAAATGTGRAMKNISQPKIRSLKVAFPFARTAAGNAVARLVASRNVAQSIRRRLNETERLIRSLTEGLLRSAER